MTTENIAYSTDTAIGLDLSSLGTSSTFVAGVESGEIDNTTNKYDDAIVFAKGIVGHASTAPVIGQTINVYVWGSTVSLATTAIDTLDGTTSAETLGHAGVLNSLKFGGAAGVTVATAALSHYIPTFSVAALFGGNMPPFWGLFVSHNHAGALGASNNSLFSYRGITYTNA